jgi:hypothetical protein
MAETYRCAGVVDNVVTDINWFEQWFFDYITNNTTQVWIKTETAQVDWIWDGMSRDASSLTAPPPPVITLAQYRAELNTILAEMENTRRNDFRDLVLAEADPPITTLAAFRADVEGRNIQWNSLQSTPEA